MDTIALAESGKIPDFLIRRGIRHLSGKRLIKQEEGGIEAQQQRLQAFVDELRSSPIAIETDAANEQHYEVPSEFYLLALGKHLKYSCAYYPEGVDDLPAAEQKMFELYAERAQLQDGMEIMDLGCGWGSLSLWLAATYPNSRITSLSNSSTQKLHIDSTAAERGLNNITVITGNINDFEFDGPRAFDRVMSIEMFEHMRNYQLLLAKVARWLKPEGRLFVHIFCHRFFAYPYELDGDDDWMARNFFTGGIMPSQDLLLRFQDDMLIDKQWLVNGVHYSKTSRDWLKNMDANKKRIRELFAETYGENQADLWVGRWRLFFLTCEEFFAMNDGNEWGVGHYLFKPR